ncbi:MAG: hypothetical protein JRC89_05305 [Deltaproteobacteria bacterium]|nr:hypothetical protein [Deltaproteobacteria bacterium]
MSQLEWHIYLDKIPFSKSGRFWVSFESDPGLKKTKTNIYDRCLPCIQNLYHQLKLGLKEISLGNAYNCWKIIAIVKRFEDGISLLSEFERRYPVGHIYGKLGSGRGNLETRVVVFHAEDVAERDRIRTALEKCLPAVKSNRGVQISRACAVLYDDLLGDWHDWLPVTKIKYPENVGNLLERLRGILYSAVM